MKHSILSAVNKALADSLATEPNVVLLGEDIGTNGGVFRATEGLQAKFGADRVKDTPLAESLIVGMSVGMAAQGLRPVAEIQFMGFIYPAMDQIVNHVARLCNRTRSRLHCPLVIRVPFGGGIHAPEHHSESMEAMLAHTPGLRVVIPSTPYHAYHLLRSAISSEDPVMFLEPKRLYHQHQQAFDIDEQPFDLGQAYIEQSGQDLTLISWGAMMHETRAAAAQLTEQGISVEVIDCASIKPLDKATLLQSVKKTGRCVIVHEAPLSVGVGAEIAAMFASEALTELFAPIERVTGYDTIMPYAKLEHHYMPSVERIMAGAEKVLQY